MAGVTDYAYRTIAAEMGRRCHCYGDGVLRALCYDDKKTVKLLRKTPTGVCGAQIFGNDPEFMAKAAKLTLELSGCDFIDINMGCPMPKISGAGDGAGLMKTPELAADIVRAVVEVVPVPVTGQDAEGLGQSHVNCVELSRMVEKAGASAVTVHGRTRVQLYTGRADWDCIRDVKQAVGIPVYANGDVDSPEAALHILRYTGADGVMIGRAAFGDPYLFSMIRAALDGRDIPQRRR